MKTGCQNVLIISDLLEFIFCYSTPHRESGALTQLAAFPPGNPALTFFTFSGSLIRMSAAFPVHVVSLLCARNVGQHKFIHDDVLPSAEALPPPSMCFLITCTYNVSLLSHNTPRTNIICVCICDHEHGKAGRFWLKLSVT